MINYFKKIGWLALFLSVVLCAGCGGSSTSATPAATTGIALNTAADFSASAAASISKYLAKSTTGVCADLADLTSDDPILADGLDCDGDLGKVAHVTPTKYAIAFKRVELVNQDPALANIDLVANTVTLANSEVVNFTTDDTSESVITIEPGDLTAGTYTGIETEMYYFQMTFPVAGVTQNVRIYMSDDDFTAEAADRIGVGPHHQGDITFINDAGTEIGWVDDNWLEANLTITRGEAQNGAGGTDSETGHDRGFFGNATLWNAEALVQGADQDIYLFTVNFDTPLVIPDPATITDLTTVTVTFSVADTFYYEDCPAWGSQNGGNGDYPGFYPGPLGGDAGGGGCTGAHQALSEWAPMTPTAVITYD